MAPHPLSPRLSAALILIVLIALVASAAEAAPAPEPAAVTTTAPAAPPKVDPAAALKEAETLFHQAEATEADAATLFGKAVTSYQSALAALDREKQRTDWVRAQVGLAAALVSQAERTVGQAAWDQLEEAKKAAGLALEVVQKDAELRMWAEAQHQLGRALRSEGAFVSGAEGEKLRTDGIAALRAALTGHDAKRDALALALIQADLGLALFSDAQSRENEPARQMLIEAAAAFRASLATFTQAGHPREWGDSQNLLGHSLREQFLRAGSSGDVALLNAAIAAYEAALAVRPRASMPVAWLLIKNNIGTAKQLLASVKEGEERSELLRQGYASIGEALEVATPEAYPQFWAPLRENQLGILLDQGEKEKATKAIVEILGVPPEMGAELEPSLLQILDKLPAELQDDPSELIARLREVLNRSMDPTLEDEHGAPEGEAGAAPAPPAGGG